MTDDKYTQCSQCGSCEADKENSYNAGFVAGVRDVLSKTAPLIEFIKQISESIVSQHITVPSNAPIGSKNWMVYTARKLMKERGL